jgi:hypothetical protein
MLKLQTCSACQDLHTMQFWSKSRNPFWSYFPFFIKFWNLLQNCMVSRSWHVKHVCSLNLTFISNSFSEDSLWNFLHRIFKQIWLNFNVFYDKRPKGTNTVKMGFNFFFYLETRLSLYSSHGHSYSICSIKSTFWEKIFYWFHWTQTW